MSTIENEVASRGWGAVLEELSQVAARERNARRTTAHDALLNGLNATTRAGREVDTHNAQGASCEE